MQSKIRCKNFCMAFLQFQCYVKVKGLDVFSIGVSLDFVYTVSGIASPFLFLEHLSSTVNFKANFGLQCSQKIQQQVKHCFGTKVYSVI